MSETLDPKKIQLDNIFHAFDTNISKIKDLIDNEYYDAAIVMMVSILEVLLRDLFIANKSSWFVSWIGARPTDEDLENRKKLRKYLHSINAYDDFLKNYYVYQQMPNKEGLSVYYTLFPENGKSLINFQNIEGRGKVKNGAMNAYLTFYNINLSELVDKDENKSDKWDSLRNLVKERHNIIHGGTSASFSQQEIIDALDSLKIMKLNLSKKMYYNYGILIS